MTLNIQTTQQKRRLLTIRHLDKFLLVFQITTKMMHLQLQKQPSPTPLKIPLFGTALKTLHSTQQKSLSPQTTTAMKELSALVSAQ